jgi:hypothetical protein
VGRLVDARIGETHVLEGDRGREPGRCILATRVVSNQRLRTQDFEYLLRRRLAQHAVVQQHAQLAQRPEHFDAHHQDDQQHFEAHGSFGHPVGAQRQRRGGAHGDAGIGNAARQRVGRQHPHGAAEHFVGALGKQARPRGALPERLERRQTLDRIQELGGESAVGPAAGPTRGAVPGDERRRRHQGD